MEEKKIINLEILEGLNCRNLVNLEEYPSRRGQVLEVVLGYPEYETNLVRE